MRSLLLLLFILPLSLIAQNKLAYVNVDEVFSKMPELKEVETKLSTKSDAIKKNMETMEAEFNAKVKEYEAIPKETLTESVAADKQKELQDLQTRYNNFLRNSQQEMDNERNTLLAPLEQKMMKAIKDVGDENGYTFILNSTALLHVGTDAHDASPQIKTKLGITN